MLSAYDAAVSIPSPHRRWGWTWARAHNKPVGLNIAGGLSISELPIPPLKGIFPPGIPPEGSFVGDSEVFLFRHLYLLVKKRRGVRGSARGILRVEGEGQD